MIVRVFYELRSSLLHANDANVKFRHVYTLIRNTKCDVYKGGYVCQNAHCNMKTAQFICNFCVVFLNSIGGIMALSDVCCLFCKNYNE